MIINYTQKTGGYVAHGILLWAAVGVASEILRGLISRTSTALGLGLGG